MGTNPKKTSWKRRLLTALCVILGVIFVLMLCLTLAVNAFLNQIPRVESNTPTLSDAEIERIIRETDPPEELAGLEEMDPEDVIFATEPAEVIEEEDHIINILLIGQDRRGTEGRARSDAMILCTIDTEKKTLTMTSFLRDLYVEYPEFQGRVYEPNRLNAAYVFGGMELLDECLYMNFGVDVDHNIEVDFSGFEKIVDIMGGVNIYLTELEAWYVGDGATEGMNHLNGAQTLRYSRIRAIDSDFGRTNRQRTVLTALMEKARGMSLSQLNRLAGTFFPMITTDMTNADIITYLFEFFPILTELEIRTQYIPEFGNYQSTYIRGMAVLVPDIEACRTVLRETLGE